MITSENARENASKYETVRLAHCKAVAENLCENDINYIITENSKAGHQHCYWTDYRGYSDDIRDEIVNYLIANGFKAKRKKACFTIEW